MNPFSAFYDNVKEKTTNPFFGTFIMVVLARNWELIYAVLNFDKEYNLSDKRRFISNYLSERQFWEELGINLGITILFFLFGYLLIILSRIIIKYVEKNIMPTIYKKVVSSVTVLKEDHDALLADRNRLQTESIKRSEEISALEVANATFKTERNSFETLYNAEKSATAQKHIDVVRLEGEKENLQQTINRNIVEKSDLLTQIESLRSKNEAISLAIDKTYHDLRILFNKFSPTSNHYTSQDVPQNLLSDYQRLSTDEYTTLEDIIDTENFSDEDKYRITYNKSHILKLSEHDLLEIMNVNASSRRSSIRVTPYGNMFYLNTRYLGSQNLLPDGSAPLH